MRKDDQIGGKMIPQYIKPSNEVISALNSNNPIVVLESTIIAHGMPYPTNIDTALKIEEIIREHGAIPATIGIIDGELKCGLSESEIKLLGTVSNVSKAGERDIPFCLENKLTAATTVGACLYVASQLGIKVLVTGGIGGVGPNGGITFDISADLPAIVEYPCITVASGTKAFMDVSATLEYFETHRVPVGSFQYDYFPFFYSRSSGIKVEWSPKDANEIAQVFKRKIALGMIGGMFIGNPLPQEDGLPEEVTRKAIEVALNKMSEEKITGKKVTPYLLNIIKEQTNGKSLQSNISLIKNNAKVGAQIAVALL